MHRQHDRESSTCCVAAGGGSPTEKPFKSVVDAVEAEKENEGIHLAASSVNTGAGDNDRQKRSAAME